MSELTTPVAIEILIDEMCDRITNYQHEAGECPGEYAVRKWLAQVQREAKIEALSEAARAFEVATINIQIFGKSHEAELVRVDNAARARVVGSLRARADRMEAGE